METKNFLIIKTKIQMIKQLTYTTIIKHKFNLSKQKIETKTKQQVFCSLHFEDILDEQKNKLHTTSA